MSNTGNALGALGFPVDTARPSDYLILVDGNEVVSFEEFEKVCRVVEELKNRASIEIKKDSGHFSLLFNKGENSYLLSMCEADSVMGDILNRFL